MDSSNLVILVMCIFSIALLYSCVGHGGASGYIALLTIAGISPFVIKPMALILNILVSLIASIQFHRAGYFRPSIFWRFAATSIPFAFLGGGFILPLEYYKYGIVLALWFSAFQLLVRPVLKSSEITPPSVSLALLIGAILGFLSGLIGVGGGIFLSPLLILMGWADNRETAAVSALFVLVNSCSGLFGYANTSHSVPASACVFALAAVGGGMLGSYLGIRHFPVIAVQRILSAVVFIAGYKVLFI